MPDPLTPAQVRHVAKLARLHLSDEEVALFAHQLSGVLDYVSKLNELNLEGVEPMAHPMDLSNVLRDDKEGPTLAVDLVLKNAPAQDPPYFAVPKVIGEGSA